MGIPELQRELSNVTSLELVGAHSLLHEKPLDMEDAKEVFGLFREEYPGPGTLVSVIHMEFSSRLGEEPASQMAAGVLLGLLALKELASTGGDSKHPESGRIAWEEINKIPARELVGALSDLIAKNLRGDHSVFKIDEVNSQYPAFFMLGQTVFRAARDQGKTEEHAMNLCSGIVLVASTIKQIVDTDDLNRRVFGE